jgi:hypothetical protein
VRIGAQWYDAYTRRSRQFACSRRKRERKRLANCRRNQPSKESDRWNNQAPRISMNHASYIHRRHRCRARAKRQITVYLRNSRGHGERRWTDWRIRIQTLASVLPD